MPTIYKRKQNSKRAVWLESDLEAAIRDIKAKVLSINAASKQYNIPSTTLRRHVKNKTIKKQKLGASCCLGDDFENKIVCHIKNLQAHGFAPTRNEVREMAFGLAQKYNLTHNFNLDEKKAGKAWFTLFMKRHPELSIRKSEGVSQNRADGMNHQKVSEYFTLLEKTLIENELIAKPGHIYNMDETGCQLNNRPEFVIAEKGSKNIPAITSAEKGETISVIACCNAEGNFLPPACVFKGKNKKSEFEDGMPPGSVVYMGGKSAYVNSEIFYTWLKEQFLPRKPLGKVLIILDGHSSHCSNAEMLEFAVANEIILLCLPPHTTQFLQPLDRSFFKSFKSHYYAASNLFIKNHPKRKISRLQFGQLLACSWNKSATPSNGISGFSATGIFPFNPEIISDYAFIRMGHVEANQQPEQEQESEIVAAPSASSESITTNSELVPIIENFAEHASMESPKIQLPTTPQKHKQLDTETNISSITPDATTNTSNITPGKMLNIISPIPSTSKGCTNARKQKARVLTTSDNIDKLKSKIIKRKPMETNNKTKVQKKRKKVVHDSSSEDENITVPLDDESDGLEDFEENLCAGCGEDYNCTLKKDDWIQCILCTMWSHDSCTFFVNTCNKCGNKNMKQN